MYTPKYPVAFIYNYRKHIHCRVVAVRPYLISVSHFIFVKSNIYFLIS